MNSTLRNHAISLLLTNIRIRHARQTSIHVLACMLSENVLYDYGVREYVVKIGILDVIERYVCMRVCDVERSTAYVLTNCVDCTGSTLIIDGNSSNSNSSRYRDSRKEKDSRKKYSNRYTNSRKKYSNRYRDSSRYISSRYTKYISSRMVIAIVNVLLSTLTENDRHIRTTSLRILYGILHHRIDRDVVVHLFNTFFAGIFTDTYDNNDDMVIGNHRVVVAGSTNSLAERCLAMFTRVLGGNYVFKYLLAGIEHGCGRVRMVYRRMLSVVEKNGIIIDDI